MEDNKVTGEGRFFEEIINEAYKSRDREGYNFVEVTNLPKNINSRSLTSLIVTASRIVPTSIDICIKKDDLGPMEQVALVKFKNETDAYRAVDKVRTSVYGKSWKMRIIKDPKFSDPEAELMSQMLLR